MAQIHFTLDAEVVKGLFLSQAPDAPEPRASATGASHSNFPQPSVRHPTPRRTALRTK